MWPRKNGRRKKFELQHQFYPNPDYCTLRITGQVTRDMILALTESEKKTQLINDLLKITGIKRVMPEPYEVKVEKESDFNWQKVLPEVEETVVQHLLNK
jgi:hypothetical protein